MPPTRKLSRSKQTEVNNEEIKTENSDNTVDTIESNKTNDKNSGDKLELKEKNNQDKKKSENNQDSSNEKEDDNLSDTKNDNLLDDESMSPDMNDDKSDANENLDTSSASEVKAKRGRGRPRKSTQSNLDISSKETKYETYSVRSKTGSESPEKNRPESEIKLRRRDKIKGTERYSPEIHEPVRRGRKILAFPSTVANINKYVNYESFDDDQSFSSQNSPQLLHTKKMLLKRSASQLEEQNSSENESKTYLVNLKKEENEVILVMPDGRTLKIEKQYKKIKKDDEDDIEEYNDDDDLDYTEDENKSNKGSKRKYATKNTRSKLSKIDLDSDDFTIPITEKKPGSVQATGIKMSKQIRKATKQQLLSSKLGDETRTTKITTPTGNGKTVTFITTPKSVTVTPTNTYLKNSNTYVKRNYGSNAKYLNEIPEISECTLEEQNSDFTVLPDKILLVNSDLPLIHSLNTETKKRVFLFTQIISVMTEYKCLLCPKSTFKEEDDLIEHYKQFHELEIEQHSAKFSEDTVFVCLPKSIIGQINENDSSSTLILDAPCQYCGDEQKLATVNDMKDHYKLAHSKEIKNVEQEEILEMYEVLFCSICSETSKDFKTHYKHMKEAHKMYTYICKQCPFFSKVPQRLVTHYRAKHLMSNKSQNLQCTFCNGILIGPDRMNKHIMTSHCVQTGVNEYSCMLCLQPCEKSDQLLAHSYQCQRKYSESITNYKEKINVNDQASIEENNFPCFLCEKSFRTDKKLQLHLNHVHTKWINTIVLNDTFLMVQHKDGKTDIMPNKNNNNNTELAQVNINDLPTNKDLEEIGAKTQYGYYCSKCECVIKIYQLYYLHMHNFHKMSKQFECKITSCKKIFKTQESFKEHIDQTNHPQKSVIEDPLLAVACHNCDSYFVDNKDIETHLLNDDHYVKVSKNADRSGMKSEARNYKCKTCHTWFGLMDSFIYHMENESHKHGCPHCGLHFALPSSRRTHIQSVHSDRADICELCNEKQGTKERLFAHLVTHNLVFECNKCMRKFYQREQLNNHMETHGEALDCPWPKCERKVNRTALSNHIRQHKIENSLKCYACDKFFQNKSQLLAHVEIHTTNDQNSKAIIATTNNNNLKNSYNKVSQINSNIVQKPKNQAVLSTTSSPPVETTLISITTAPSSNNKQRTYGNRSLSGSTNKMNNILGKSTNKYQFEKISNTKLMCFTCNQIFANHNELSEHKCSIPVVTITKEISNVLTNEKTNETNDNQNELIFTTDKLNGNNECILIADNGQDAGIKHVLTLQTNLDDKNKKKVTPVTSISSSHNRFMESNKKTYDFQNRAKKTYSSLKSKSSNSINNSLKTNDNQIFIETQSPINQTTQLFLTNSNQIATLNSNNIELDSNTVSTIQALIQDNQIIQTGNNEVLQIPLDQHAVVLQDQPATTEQVQSTQQVQVATEGQEQVTDTSQYIMIQQPDGQCVQICIPEGMDVDEVIKNLNFTWQAEEEQQQTVDQQTTQLLDTQQLLEQQQLIADQQNQMIAEQQLLDQQQQINLDQGIVEQLQSGEQQVIYLPVNEDGTCAIDAESLAMLTVNGEIPIIVSSSN